MQGQAVLLFVHGYNTSFEAAVEKAAQLKVDMPWSGTYRCLLLAQSWRHFWTTPVMKPCTRNRYHPFWIPRILCRLMSEIAHLFVDVTVETVFMRALCTTTEAGYCKIVQVTLKNTYYVYMTVLQEFKQGPHYQPQHGQSGHFRGVSCSTNLLEVRTWGSSFLQLLT